MRLSCLRTKIAEAMGSHADRELRRVHFEAKTLNPWLGGCFTALESTSCQAVSSCCVNTGSVLGGTWFQVLRWSVLASAAACYRVFSHAAEQPSFDLLPGTRACHVRVCKSKCIDSKSSKQPSAEP